MDEIASGIIINDAWPDERTWRRIQFQTWRHQRGAFLEDLRGLEPRPLADDALPRWTDGGYRPPRRYGTEAQPC